MLGSEPSSMRSTTQIAPNLKARPITPPAMPVFCATLSLSQISSDWRETASRVILAPDVGRLQIALVAAHRVIPIASVT